MKKKCYLKCPHCRFKIQGTPLELLFTEVCPGCLQPIPREEVWKAINECEHKR